MCVCFHMLHDPVFPRVSLCPYLVVPVLVLIEFHLFHLCSPNDPRLVRLLKPCVFLCVVSGVLHHVLSPAFPMFPAFLFIKELEV